MLRKHHHRTNLVLTLGSSTQPLLGSINIDCVRDIHTVIPIQSLDPRQTISIEHGFDVDAVPRRGNELHVTVSALARKRNKVETDARDLARSQFAIVFLFHQVPSCKRL